MVILDFGGKELLYFSKRSFLWQLEFLFYSRILKVLFKKNSWLYSHDFLKKFWALLGDNLRLSGKELLYSLKRSFIVKSPAVFFQDCVGFIKRKIQLYSYNFLKKFPALHDSNLRFCLIRALIIFKKKLFWQVQLIFLQNLRFYLKKQPTIFSQLFKEVFSFARWYS